MKQALLFLLLLVRAATGARCGHLGIPLKDIKPRIAGLLEYETNRDPRHYMMHEWRLRGYGQAQTGLVALVDDGYVTDLSYQFYLGFDAEREAHYRESLPVLKGLFEILMPALELREEQIHQHLRCAKAEQKPVRLTDGKFVTTITYKFTPTEDADRYRSFVVEFGEGQRNYQ